MTCKEQKATSNSILVSWCHQPGLLAFPERAYTPCRMFHLASLHFPSNLILLQGLQKTLFSDKSEAGLKDIKRSAPGSWPVLFSGQCQTFDKLHMEEFKGYFLFGELGGKGRADPHSIFALFKQSDMN